MARTRSTSIREEAQKRRRTIVEGEDVISQLPDDILVAILSLLSFVEAASSCVLSKRWKSLWTHLTVLNFEFPKMLKEPIKIAESMPVARAKFVGGMTQVLVRLRHAPSLVCLTLEHRGGILTAFPSISSCFSQLESLTLDIYVGMFSSAPPPLPELTNLKNLTLQGMIGSGCSLLGWASLIERCPCLHKFTSQMWSRFNLQNKVSRPAERLHKCLKVVEFVFNIDFELAAYFVQNALALEKIIVDCCSGRLVRPGCNVAEHWLELPKHAEKLKKELPPEVELVII